MKKIFALMAIASLSVMSLNAQSETNSVDDGIAKKWELRIDGAWGSNLRETKDTNNGVITAEESTKINFGIGYNFTSNWYLGLGSGYSHNMGGGKNHYMPLLGDVAYRWNGDGGKWSFFLEGRGGYMFSIGGERTLKNGRKYEAPNGLMFDVQPGVYYRVKPNIDLKLSVGYMHFNPEDDTPDIMHCTNNLVVKLGVNIRKAVKAPTRTVIEEPVVEEPKEEVKVEETPAPVTIVETTTPEQRELGQREVVIYYSIRQHNILPEKDALLQEMAEFVKTHNTGMIILKSYADKGTGNYQLNQMYSRNRMNEVKKHLIDMYGIAEEKIDASYYGDTVQPFEENDLNRCSIITVKEIE